MTATDPPQTTLASRRPAFRRPACRRSTLRRSPPASLLILASLACLGWLQPGCTREAAGPPARPNATAPAGSVVVTLGGRPFNLEVAATDVNRQLGLMFRKSMPADAGMIFVFPREQELGFWMKNTEIPLDIVYLDAAGRVVSVKQMEPHDLGRTPSDGPARFAIELNKGTAGPLGIKPGDTIDLPDRVRNPPDLD